MTCLQPGALEQGPEWLMRILYCGPDWLMWAVNGAILFVLVVGIAAMHLVEWDEQLKREMAWNAGLVALIAGSTVAVRELFLPGYLPTVVLGFSIGTVAWVAIARKVGLDG